MALLLLLPLLGFQQTHGIRPYLRSTSPFLPLSRRNFLVYHRQRLRPDPYRQQNVLSLRQNTLDIARFF